MALIGILAEYNPLHRGHAYQLATLSPGPDSGFDERQCGPAWRVCYHR